MPPGAKRLLPAAGTAAIRCYGQGLGDCFLLAFPRPGKPDDPFYVVIDCGIAMSTPHEEMRMQKVVADIRTATGSHVDVLAVTHEHYDHVVGFVHAEEAWRKIDVDRLFLPWTEKPNDPDAATVRDKALRLSRAAHRAAEQVAGLAEVGYPIGLRLEGSSLRAGAESFGLRADEKIALGRKIALERCPEEERRVYCEPGDVLALGDTGVSAYVLGPPRPTDQAGQPLLGRTGKPLVFVLEDHREMYSYADFGLVADGGGHGVTLHADGPHGASAALTSALLGEGNGDFDRYCPFDPTMQIAWEDALTTPFFWKHYTATDDWRRVDYDWLDDASELALRAGDFTNNISLVLAFELPQSKDVLLFVGDAQVGNWLSWHRIKEWRHKDPAVPSAPANMDDLLGRVAFYKVGHHGSHNATIREQGLEKMRDGLVAYVPVSVPVAHDVMRYCPMPFYPVLLALQRKARGQVYLANGKLLEPVPAGAEQPPAGVVVRRSSTRLPEKIRDEDTPAPVKLEAAVPLWTEFVFADQPPD